jgi:putative transferase (TIGR04331 family)
MPICFLEGFSTILNDLDKIGWPEKPKFIFTSNSFDTDETFKVWVGLKTELGSKYIVGQHGGMYGTDRWFQNTIEEITSDEFLTWGWDGRPLVHTPAFVLKTKQSKKIQVNRQQILLIQKFDMVRDRTWDELSTFHEYFRNQTMFINCLNSEIRGSILLRLHPQVTNSLHDEISMWKNYSSELQIEFGTKSIFELFYESAIIIHTYDSTGFLESLSLDLPTIAFWEHGLDHLVDLAIPSYKLLVEVGILHFTPESAANKLNEISPDITSWWNSGPVQRARKEFCDKYARHENRKSKKLKQILVP